MMRAGKALRAADAVVRAEPQIYWPVPSLGLACSLEVGIAAGMRGASGPSPEPGITIGCRSQSSRICERR